MLGADGVLDACKRASPGSSRHAPRGRRENSRVRGAGSATAPANSLPSACGLLAGGLCRFDRCPCMVPGGSTPPFLADSFSEPCRFGKRDGLCRYGLGRSIAESCGHAWCGPVVDPPPRPVPLFCRRKLVARSTLDLRWDGPGGARSPGVQVPGGSASADAGQLSRWSARTW